MANKTESKLVLTGDPKGLIQTVNEAERQIKKFGNTVNHIGARIDKFGTKTQKAFRSKGTRFGGLGLGGLIGVSSLVLAGKQTIDFIGDLGKLAGQADMTKAEVFRLKEVLNDYARATYQDQGDLLKGFGAIIERTGNVQFATDVIERLGIIATATSSNVQDIGYAASDLNEKLKISPSEITKAFDILATQGKSGAFELNKMAELFPRLLSAAAGFGTKGLEGLRSFGAYLQFAMKGTGNAQLAATAVENTLSDILKKSKEIYEQTGFSIYDLDQWRKDGKMVLKDFETVIKEIIRKTKGSEEELNKIFGERSIRAVRVLASSYKEYGDFREFNNLVNIAADGSVIINDFNKRISFTDQAFKKLTINMQMLKDTFFLKPVQDLGGVLDLITPKLEEIGKLPFFDRSLWLGIGTVIAGVASGVGILSAGLYGITATVGYLTGGSIGSYFRKKIPDFDKAMEHVLTTPLQLGGKGGLLEAKTGPRLIDMFMPNYDYALPSLSVLQRQAINGPQSNFRASEMKPSVFNMHVNISDKQVSVISDSGVNPNVTVTRGPYQREHP